MKIKLNLKVEEICRDSSPDFEINVDAPSFSLVLSQGTSALSNTLHRVFCKNTQRLNTVKYVCTELHLRCFTGL